MGCIKTKDEVIPTPVVTSTVEEDSPEDTIVTCLVGPKSCGKSCLLHRLMKNEWKENVPNMLNDYSREEGVQFFFRPSGEIVTKDQVDHKVWCHNIIIEILEKDVKDKEFQKRVQFWNRHLKAFILVFELDKQESFDSLVKFNPEYLRNYTYYAGLPKFILGLKSDLESDVKKADIDSLVDTLKPVYSEGDDIYNENYHWRYLEISAKDGTGINKFVEDFKKGVDLFKSLVECFIINFSYPLFLAVILMLNYCDGNFSNYFH